MRTALLSLLLISSLSLAQCPDWAPASIAQQLKVLEKHLKQWDQAYHQQGHALISDPLYDQVLQRREQLSACIQAPAEHQPLADLKGPRAHPVAHAALPKLKDLAEVERWLKSREQIWVQPKVDGMAVSVRYQDGALVELLSRGDGQQGFDLLRHAAFIQALPATLSQPLSSSFQGELYLIADRHIQAQQGNAGHRSQLVGLIRRHQPVPANTVGFFLWQWPHGPRDMGERLAALEALGFGPLRQWSVPVRSAAEVQALRAHWFSTPLPFSTDGVVLKHSLHPASERWHTGPSSWSAAWKYPSAQTAAYVKQVHFRIGRTGRITPVLELYPVRLEERNIRWVSLGSLARWQRLDIRPHDLIAIHLAGGSIPHVSQILTQASPRVPVTQPEPGRYHPLSCWRAQPDCEEQFLARLVWLSGAHGLNLQGVSKGTWQRWLAHQPEAHLVSWLQADTGLHPKHQATARQQGFARWLNALGAPLSAKDWPALQAQSLQPSPAARRLRAWLEHPEVHAIRCQLADLAVEGFPPC